jgi:hypothetical protein
MPNIKPLDRKRRMQLNEKMLKANNNGWIKPIALISGTPEKQSAVLQDLSSRYNTFRLNLQHAERSSIIYEKEDHQRHIQETAEAKNTQPLIGKIASAVSGIFEKKLSPDLSSEEIMFDGVESLPGWRIKDSLEKLFASNHGDLPAVLIIDLVQTADADAQKAIMDYVTGNITGIDPKFQLSKNVVVVFPIEPEVGVFNQSGFDALIRNNCTFVDLATQSLLPEYVESSERLAKMLASPKMFSLSNADTFAQLNQDKEKIERFVGILAAMEGGAYGSEAASRGVDEPLLQALLSIPQAERSAGTAETELSSLSKLIDTVFNAAPAEPKLDSSHKAAPDRSSPGLSLD